MMGALLRRIAAATTSGLIVWLGENWHGITEHAFLEDLPAATWWPVAYLTIEAIQKLIRERKKAR